MDPVIINKFGTLTGWAKIRMEVLGRSIVGFSKISYNDEREDEIQYGQGNFPIGKGEGNYKASCSFDLIFEERVGILVSLPPKMRIQDIPDFDITVMYNYKGKDYKDVIRNCSFLNNGVEGSQGDKVLTYGFNILTTHIDWNV